MLPHLLKSINWIDVLSLFIFVRIIFIGVKSGFVAEFFKTLGVVVAVFISFHYYSYLAAWMAQKTHFSWEYWDWFMFADLWLAAVFFFKFVRDGILFLFKVETNHEGFDKYGAGLVAVGRGMLVCSLSLFLVLLSHNGPVVRMTLRSYSYKIAGGAALGTYTFLYGNLVDKLVPTEHYNKSAPKVLHPDAHADK